MNIYNVRENMIMEYLKDVEGADVTAVYVTETKDADLLIDITNSDGHTYTESLQMSFVMAWVWSKIK